MNSKTLGALFIISGTAIGGGMLAIPEQLYMSGVFSGIFALCLCWFFMTLSAYLLLKSNIELKNDVDFFTIIQKTLGSTHQKIFSFFYLLLLYALLAAYLKGGAYYLTIFFSDAIFEGYYLIALSIIMSVFLLCGLNYIDNINKVLFVVLLIVLFGLQSDLLEHFTFPSHFNFVDVNALYHSLPLLVTAFGFAIVVPFLAQYINYNKKQLSFSLMIGSVLPLTLYVIWFVLAIGNFSTLEVLTSLLQEKDSFMHLLMTITSSSTIHIFSVLALYTSFLGVSASLYHFLNDATSRIGWSYFLKAIKKYILCALVFIPAILFLYLYPKGFAQFLSLAGIFVAIILGIYPILIYRALFTIGNKEKYVLLISMLFFIMIIIIEVMNILQYRLD